MTDKVTNPHDAFFKHYLSQPGVASDFLRQPSGLEMVMALLRYISRSGVKLDKAEITQKLLTHLPQEGGVLMETLAQEWIDIGKKEGIDIGKKEGIDIGKKEGIVAQRQTLLHLLQWRFQLSAEESERYSTLFAKISNLDHLLKIIDQLLTSQTPPEFEQKLYTFLPTGEEQE